MWMNMLRWTSCHMCFSCPFSVRVGTDDFITSYKHQLLLNQTVQSNFAYVFMPATYALFCINVLRDVDSTWNKKSGYPIMFWFTTTCHLQCSRYNNHTWFSIDYSLQLNSSELSVQCFTPSHCCVALMHFTLPFRHLNWLGWQPPAEREEDIHCNLLSHYFTLMSKLINSVWLHSLPI